MHYIQTMECHPHYLCYLMIFAKSWDVLTTLTDQGWRLNKPTILYNTSFQTRSVPSLCLVPPHGCWGFLFVSMLTFYVLKVLSASKVCFSTVCRQVRMRPSDTGQKCIGIFSPFFAWQLRGDVLEKGVLHVYWRLLCEYPPWIKVTPPTNTKQSLPFILPWSTLLTI